MTTIVQYLIVAFIIAAAVAYGAVTLVRKRRAFSSKAVCGTDCGCGPASKPRRSIQ